MGTLCTQRPKKSITKEKEKGDKIDKIEWDQVAK